MIMHMPSALPCVVCGHDRWLKIFHRLGFDYVRCVDCGLIRTDPLPTPAEISAHYTKQFESGNYKLLQRFAPDYQAIYVGFAELIRRHCPDPAGRKLLDIGCFSGEFLDLAHEAGFLTYGVEYQREAAAIASAKHGGRVFCGPVETYSPPEALVFDVVTAFGVIEHVTAPELIVRVAARLLRPPGLFIIQTPNTGSLPAKLLGRTWPPFAPVEHVYYFSSRNIAILLESHGLKVVSVIRHWKSLPIEYVYRQLENFGPEYYRLAKKIVPLLPSRLLKLKLPFYGGEMLIVSQKQ